MIESFQIRDVATYDATGISCDELKKINVIYGPNGSGKTTISKLLGDPSESCTVNWSGRRPLDIKVYNKHFKEKNILNDTKLKGVFTIGEENIDNERLIEKKKTEVIEKEQLSSGLQKKLDEQKSSLETLKGNSADFIWAGTDSIRKSELKNPLSGCLNSRTNFFSKILAELNSTAPLLDLTELEEQSKSIYQATRPSSLPQIISIGESGLEEIEDNKIWNDIIVGKSDVNISALIESLDISDWVNRGLNYIQENEDTCPFCQKNTIDHDFRKNIESYFDETYKENSKLLDSLKDSYTLHSEKVLTSLQQIASNHQKKAIYHFDSTLFAQTITQLENKIKMNLNAINSKIQEPSRILDLYNTATELTQLQSIIDGSNLIIDKHNLLITNLSSSKTNLIKHSWKYIAELNRGHLESYNDKKKGISKAISKITDSIALTDKNIKKLEKEIEDLSKSKTNTRQTITEINSSLRYFGFTGFSIDSIDGKHYQLKRSDGSIANETLSEGEVTFITFLYFYHLSKGGETEETISTNRVIVIDDPISSLDSNILFVVSSLVKDIIYTINNDSNNKIKQLIVLTHNVYFHKEISYKLSNDVNFWNLRKTSNTTSIKNYYNKNPISSSYELLWQELKEGAGSKIALQNSMRRIIENYFKILGGIGDNDILACFQCPNEQLICRSLICWVNDGSHCIPDDLYVDEQSSTIKEYKRIFKDIFDKTNHISHYNMMMKDR